jgi:hypothetical protein
VGSTRHELVARSPFGDGKFAVPVALELEACWVIRSTSPAVVIPHLVLERLAFHGEILPGPSAPHHPPVPEGNRMARHHESPAPDVPASVGGSANALKSRRSHAPAPPPADPRPRGPGRLAARGFSSRSRRVHVPSTLSATPASECAQRVGAVTGRRATTLRHHRSGR